jgi:hypothetical protein
MRLKSRMQSVAEWRARKMSLCFPIRQEILDAPAKRRPVVWRFHLDQLRLGARCTKPKRCSRRSMLSARVDEQTQSFSLGIFQQAPAPWVLGCLCDDTRQHQTHLLQMFRLPGHLCGHPQRLWPYGSIGRRSAATAARELFRIFGCPTTHIDLTATSSRVGSPNALLDVHADDDKEAPATASHLLSRNQSSFLSLA